jgi:hypothetical protein
MGLSRGDWVIPHGKAVAYESTRGVPDDPAPFGTPFYFYSLLILMLLLLFLIILSGICILLKITKISLHSPTPQLSPAGFAFD